MAALPPNGKCVNPDIRLLGSVVSSAGVDGIVHPPVYGRQRALLLHRAKISLNLLPTWDDSALAYRWPLVAASRSLLVTESSLPHAPEYQPGIHYVSAPVSDLVDTICYYLAHPAECESIIERAYQSVTQRLTMRDGVHQIMQLAECAVGGVGAEMAEQRQREALS